MPSWLLSADIGTDIEKVYDRATPIAEDYQASLRMLIEGGLLAVVVVFLFLRNIRRPCSGCSVATVSHSYF